MKGSIRVYLLNPQKTLYFQGISPVLCSSLMYFPLFLPLRAETGEIYLSECQAVFRQVIRWQYSTRARAKYTSRTNLQLVRGIFRPYRELRYCSLNLITNKNRQLFYLLNTLTFPINFMFPLSISIVPALDAVAYTGFPRSVMTL